MVNGQITEAGNKCVRPLLDAKLPPHLELPNDMPGSRRDYRAKVVMLA